MPERTEAEELRALQAKAYRRGGALTAAESQRLDELETVRRSAAVPIPPPAGPEAGESVPPPSAAPDLVRAEAAPHPAAPDAAAPDAAAPDPAAPIAEESASGESPASPETPLGVMRRHAGAVAAASALLLAIGLGAGWALFAPRPAGIPLDAAQQQRRAELAAEVFDPGSVRAIAQQADALAWFATQDGGGLLCLVLDTGALSQTECAAADAMEYGLSAVLAVPREDAEQDALFGDGFDGETVYATLFLSTTGEPMAGIQRWTATSSMTAPFEGEEHERAEELVDEGYSLALSVVGNHRGEPVWLGDRLSAQGATERCMIVDATETVVCASFGSALSEGLGVQTVDVGEDGAGTASMLDLRFTRQQTPYLTITESPVSEVAPGDSVVVQAPPGDPIEVEPPDRGADG